MIKNAVIRFLRKFSKLCRSCKGKGVVWYAPYDIRKKFGKLCDFRRCPYC